MTTSGKLAAAPKFLVWFPNSAWINPQCITLCFPNTAVLYICTDWNRPWANCTYEKCECCLYSCACFPYRRQRHVVVITQKCFSDRWDQSLRDTKAKTGISAVVRLITRVLSWCHRVASQVILYVALWHCFCRSESEASWYEVALTEQSPQLLGKTQTLTFYFLANRTHKNIHLESDGLAACSTDSELVWDPSPKPRQVLQLGLDEH